MPTSSASQECPMITALREETAAQSQIGKQESLNRGSGIERELACLPKPSGRGAPQLRWLG